MVKKRLVVASFLIAILIFFSGILAGWVIERYVSSNQYDELIQGELDIKSYLIEQEFAEVFGGDSCQLLESRLEGSGWTVHKLRRQIAIYDQQVIISPTDYNLLLRRYYIFEVNLLTTLEKIKEECGKEYTNIVFFYRIGDLDSKKQGLVLDAYSLENNFEPIVVTLNAEFDEPLIKFLMDYYEIDGDDLPVTVINGQVNKGLVDIDTVRELTKQNS